MAKRGSITIFLALILSLIVSLLGAGIQSVRMAAARTQILNGLDIGLYSLFAQYDKPLLKDFDLFAIDAQTGGELDLARVYDSLETYMKPVLSQNSQTLSFEQGGISGYRLLTESQGEVFYQQTVNYMKETLGSHGVQLLLKKMRERQNEIKKEEESGVQAENGNLLETYDSEMSAAAEKSQAALEEKKAQEEQNTEGGFTDGNVEEAGGFTDIEVVPTKVDNPIPTIRRIRWMGLLDLVLPAGKDVSDKTIEKKNLVSGRDLQESLPMKEAVKKETALTSQLLYQQYLTEKLGNYIRPGKGGLTYQIEYILGGQASDEANLKSIARKLLLVREGVNCACLAADAGKRAQAAALAAAIASGFLIPPAAGIIEGALILCWAFGESVLDVRNLFAGGKVPLVKEGAQWQLSLENLPHLLEILEASEKKEESGGMSYEDYLQVFLLSANKSNKVLRGMDMVEQTIRAAEGWESFRLDCCIAALEASVDVKANGQKTFNVTREYGYT